jgi:ComEC/Rec2-related protein
MSLWVEAPSADEWRAVTVVLSAFGAVAAAVWLHLSVPVVVVLCAGVVAALTLHRTAVLVLLLCLIIVRANGVVDALDPVPTRPVESFALRLVTDPKPTDGRWVVLVDLDGDRLFASAQQSAGAELAGASAGDWIIASGTVRGSRPRTAWALSRRVVGNVQLTHIRVARTTGGLMGAANTVRNHIVGGATSLSAERRALFTGLVYGDDRRQTAIAADNFRAAGLGHLLAVSGQNVLFVLVLATPIISRFRSMGIRLLATLGVLTFFGFMTRFEPSVTRALVMAGVATVGSLRGEPAAALRTLPLAVVGLLVVNPLLGLSLAFQLSVAATAGLVLITPRLAALFLRDDWVIRALSATGGAQLAVAPLLLVTFGTMSPIAIPANVLAAPAAAFVMMWGLTAGVVAGFGPAWLANVLHLPTRAAIWWIDTIARVAADVPVSPTHWWHIAAVVTGIIAASWKRGPLRSVGVLIIIGVLLHPFVAPSSPPVGSHGLAHGIELQRTPDGHDIVLLQSGVRTADALSSIREANLGRIDLLVATSGERELGRVVAQLRERFEIVDIWAPAGHQIPGARVRLHSP